MTNADTAPLRGRLHHLQLGSPDPQRLATFYEDVLGMVAQPLEGRWLCRGQHRNLFFASGPAKTLQFAAYQVAEVYAYRNDKDHAFEWLERARRQHDAGLPILRADTLLPNLHGDPRWNAFLRTMGLADDQLK